MNYETYEHRYADIILNSDYELKKGIFDVIQSIDTAEVERRFNTENTLRKHTGKKLLQGKQSTINSICVEEFKKRGWETEKNIFNDPKNDLAIDYWKRNVGVDVAFNHRSFIGGDLLRFQAAAEVKNVIKMGVYACPVKEFTKWVCPKDSSSMVTYERAKWYLESFYAVITVPILLLGIKA
ncbi:restriction endonuclease [candidate division WOR-3 bacterium]|nr:restriction endonuclease [candidate division WOR-3 bacterium]